MFIPTTKCNIGKRVLSVAAPSMLNQLPIANKKLLIKYDNMYGLLCDRYLFVKCMLTATLISLLHLAQSGRHLTLVDYVSYSTIYTVSFSPHENVIMLSS